MSELQNPLFDDEKEFLERKKLEYERALRGDVDHIKEQSVVVGKVALVGVGIAGGIWLITKAFGSKKRKKKRAQQAGNDHDDHEGEYYTAANGKRYNSAEPHKSAAASAQIFEDHHENQHESDDLGFGSMAYKNAHAEPAEHSATSKARAFADPDFEADPFEDLPYDDSRRLPTSHAFDDDQEARDKVQATAARNSRTRMIGSVLQSFLQSDTGKVLVAQAGAVALAIVTKKVGEFFPATKNSDLAASPGSAAAANGTSPVASPAPSVSSDASNPPQSI
ncbi:hypothetical protein [Hymenobacter antarcticus]|uniref:YtxH-like protein n=1 Tax=Hymenobacter antarcticus TaxID=486270 RepID=A0ABP7P4P7_9BACT